MADFYEYPIKTPRTIDRLEIIDCVEIIVNDLGRYGVNERLAMTLVEECFIPLKRRADALKREYGQRCFAGTPDSAFDNCTKK